MDPPAPAPAPVTTAAVNDEVRTKFLYWVGVLAGRACLENFESEIQNVIDDATVDSAVADAYRRFKDGYKYIELRMHSHITQLKARYPGHGKVIDKAAASIGMQREGEQLRIHYDMAFLWTKHVLQTKMPIKFGDFVRKYQAEGKQVEETFDVTEETLKLARMAFFYRNVSNFAMKRFVDWHSGQSTMLNTTVMSIAQVVAEFSKTPIFADVFDKFQYLDEQIALL